MNVKCVQVQAVQKKHPDIICYDLIQIDILFLFPRIEAENSRSVCTNKEGVKPFSSLMNIHSQRKSVQPLYFMRKFEKLQL